MSVPTEESLLNQARRLAEMAAERAGDIEAQRRLPGELIQAMTESGLLKILQPRRYGGYEMDMGVFVRVTAEIARGDASTGWIFAILGIHNWWLGYVDPRLQEEVWGEDTHRFFADSFAPVGKVQPASGGYRLSGRWKFLSGIEWSDYAAVAAFLPSAQGEEPEYAMFFLPQSQYRIEDEWHVVGLRGTASNTIIVDDVFVPEYRVFQLGRILQTGEAPGQALNPGPLYRLPFFTAISLALVAPVVGAARAAVTHFRQWIQTRVPLFKEAAQKELGSAQMALAEAATTLDALENLMQRYADDVMVYGRERRLPSEEERARYYAWRSYMVRQAIHLVDRLFELSGGHSIFESHPIQRIWRDVHTAAQHVTLNFESSMEAYGRTLVGLPSQSIL
ncbi:MAG: hypothetical protein D6723_05455 [Acidobacteria bacterium]|nr:MAG: hypothetical protein D6723_05455 [Acidobacteriota bacterium]